MHVAGCRRVRHALGHEHLELLIDEHERHGRGHTLDRLAESVVAYNIGVMAAEGLELLPLRRCETGFKYVTTG